MDLRRRWSGVGPVAAVFGLAAALLLALTIADGVALRTQMAPASELFAGDFHRRVWWEISRLQVLFLGVSIVAAVAAQLVASSRSPGEGRNGSLAAGRVAFGGAVVWLIGVVVSSGWWWLTGSDSGWFNGAPNAGVVFSGGGGPDRELIGLVVACSGLGVALGAAIWSMRSADEG